MELFHADQNALRRFIVRKKECLILISHQEKIINMADKIMVIEDGEVKKYGTKEDVPTLFQQEKCQKCLNEGGKC